MPREQGPKNSGPDQSGEIRMGRIRPGKHKRSGRKVSFIQGDSLSSEPVDTDRLLKDIDIAVQGGPPEKHRG